MVTIKKKTGINKKSQFDISLSCTTALLYIIAFGILVSDNNVCLLYEFQCCTFTSYFRNAITILSKIICTYSHASVCRRVSVCVSICS